MHGAVRQLADRKIGRLIGVPGRQLLVQLDAESGLVPPVQRAVGESVRVGERLVGDLCVWHVLLDAEVVDVEAYAAWRSAWRALGRPDADRAEAEMSTGQLRMRIRAYDREKTWAPDYVADQLAGTRQAADKHRQDATLWNGQADAMAEHSSAARLRDEAARSFCAVYSDSSHLLG
jgi:hypothetical protein